MKRLFVIAVAVALAACDQRTAVNEMARCNRELGSADAHLATAQAAQTAAERKAQALEEELRSAREELAVARAKGPGAAAAAPAVAAAEDAPLPAAPSDSAGAKRGAIRVGLSLHGSPDERWVKDKLTMLAEARKRGLDLRVQIGDETAERQLAQAETLIAEGVKVLIVVAQDAAAAAEIVNRAAKAGVQVICYDRLILNSPYDYYLVSFDSVKVGEIMGAFLAKKVPKGNYLVLRGSPTDQNAKWVYEGQMKVLKPLIDRGDVKVIGDEAVPSWDESETQRRCEKILDTGVHVDAVTAPSDGMASGCIKALEARGLAGKVFVTGQDAELAAAIRVLHGTQGMTVFKDTRVLGKRTIEIAEALARGKAVPTGGQTVNNNKRAVKAVLLTPQLITKENLDVQLIASGYLPRAAVYRK